jgi:hypothetical protein
MAVFLKLENKNLKLNSETLRYELKVIHMLPYFLVFLYLDIML